MAHRWGIMGTGIIAEAFLTAIRAEGSDVVAVSSADPARAQAFAAAHGVEVACAPHARLLAEAEVDVVYIATTNERHHLDAAACIAAGIPALVEKPFALDAATARAVLTAAEGAGIFVAEAMWMRLQPAYQRLRAELAAGTIGQPGLVEASFGVVLNDDPQRRWRSAALGGGTLLDTGIYPATLAHDVLGAATEVRATGMIGPTEVDLRLGVTTNHPTGVAVWSTSFLEPAGVRAQVSGTEGRLVLGEPFHHAPSLTLIRADGGSEELPVVDPELAYRLEVREVERCLAAGEVHSPWLRPEDTLAVLDTLDQISTQIGLRRPPLAPLP